MTKLTGGLKIVTAPGPINIPSGPTLCINAGLDERNAREK